jgi:large subunit ribosomal protein L5
LRCSRFAGAGRDLLGRTPVSTATAPTLETYVPRLKQRYDTEIRAQLQEELGLSSIMQVPRVTKVTLNMGVGEAKTDAKALDAAIDELTVISGQRAQIRRAKKSIASFKLREGMPIGAKVTLRGARMYEFLDRLASIALPRIRDFRGLDPKGFDGRGNYSIGIREQIIFPEVDYDRVPAIRGLDVAITTSAETDEHGSALLAALGLPLQRRQETSNREPEAGQEQVEEH